MPAEFFLPGYFKGKRNAEQALFNLFPNSGVAVRPGFMHGTRQVGSVGIPLSAVGGSNALACATGTKFSDTDRATLPQACRWTRCWASCQTSR